MARDASKSKPRGAMGKPPQAAKGAHKAHKAHKPSKPAQGHQAGAKPHQKHQKGSDHGQPTSDLAAGNLTQVVAALQADKSVRWFEAEPKLKGAKREEDGESLTPTDELVVTLKKRAQRLLEDEVARFEKQKSGKMSSDDKYLATMMKSGTLSDRVASLTLTVQASPFHSLLRVGQLISMASKKARRESLMAVDSLKDLFLNNLLPDDRKLRFFHQHPLRLAQHSPAHLVLWFFEHCLKTAYAQLCGVLSAGMDDAVDSHKRACLRAASTLLRAKPEQEAVLLAMLVNKLGDPDRKIAAYLHRMLQDVLREHPAMKRVVVDEVERLLTRPKVSDRAKYNAVLFLNQIYLDSSGDDEDLAGHLISVYFGLFSKEVHGLGKETQKTKKSGKKGKKDNKKSNKKDGKAPTDAEAMDRKLLSSLLVGVNRAFPYANATAANFTEEIDALFEVVHRAHHSTSVQALMLLFQVMNSTNSVSDRFYTALYAKLADPKLRETSKHTLFLNLIFRAMKADVSPPRSSAFAKRLLQLAGVMPPAFACAVLFLLSELFKVKPQLRTMLDQPEAGNTSGDRQDDEHFEDVQTEKQDAVAFELEEEEEEDDDDSTLETENAVQDDGLTDAERSQKVLEQMFGKAPATEKNAKLASTGVVSFDEPEPAAKSETKEGTTGYDPTKRNPLFAGAETSCAWELHMLVHHYHPSVGMFARQLLDNKGTGIQYAGDPLVDFTLHAFFEKFVNKKPRHKATVGTGVDSDAQARAKSWTFAAINSEAVLQESEATVDASDQFFYKFFKERASRDASMPGHRKKKKSSKSERDGDVLSDVEDDDEEMEAYAQQLAEGIMEDGNLDDEDPDTADWSDGDDEEGGEELKLDGEDEDDADAVVFGNGEDDEADDEVEEDDDDDEEDGFDFSAMDGMDDEDDVLQEELEALEAKRQKQTPPKAGAKRKSPFASADNYEQMVRDALAKQKQKDAKPRGKKKSRRA